jgi:eukaryotic-like serine/threonine-protein kinase
MSSEAPISAVDIEQAVKRFEGAWQRGEQPAISNYCQEVGPRSSALLQALVVVDLECRLKSGQRRSAEDYLREFPQLQSQEQTILALLRVEARWQARGDSPSPRDPLDAARDSEENDPADKSGSAEVETVSGADHSVVAPTRTSAGNPFSEPNFSGVTVSAHESPPAAKLPASRMLGKFRLVDVVGQGGFGTVFRAIDTGLGRVVAIKVPKEGVLGSEKEQERFIREAQSAAALRHDHIVRVYEVGGTRERPFIVSEFVPGCTLSKALASRRFEPLEAASIVRVVADALHYAHERGVIHRDVKPSNIMLDNVGEPHLMDFGLARREGEVLITIAGQILGTPAYMSPEQAEGKSAGAKSDIYSLGVVLYELLTGERPFRGNVQSVLQQVINAQPLSPIVANRAVPRDIEKICLKCVQKLAVDRYESARELEEDLSRFLEGLPVRARPISPVARTWRWARRHPKTAVLIAVAAILSISLPVVQAISKSEVEKARQRLDQERENALRSEEANRARLEKLFVSKGNEKIEAGKPMLALPWFAAALEQVPPGIALATPRRVQLVTALEGLGLARLWRAGGPVLSVARCPTRPLLAIAPAAKAAMVLDLTTPDAPAVVLRHPDTLSQCAFSRDGRRLATSCTDHNVRIWLTSALSNEPLVLQHNKEDYLTWIEFDPTSRLLASATDTGAVRLWDVSTGTLVAPILALSKAVNHLAFNVDGSLLAAACSDGAAHVWSVGTARELTVLKHEHDSGVNCVRFGTHGDALYSGGEDGTVRAWNPKSQSQQFALIAASPVLHFAISADGTLLAAGCQDGRVRVWNLETRAPLGEFHHEQQISALSFSGTSNTLLTGSLDQTVRIWDLTTGAAAAPPFVCAGKVTWLELARDRRHLMSAGLDGILREWTLDTPFKAEQRCADIGAPSIVQLSPNGRWLLLTGAHGRTQLCDLNDRKLTFVRLADSLAAHAAFSSNGKRMVLARESGDLDLWDVSQEPKRIRTISGNGSLNDVGFSPDGQSLVTANIDGSARVLSLADGGPSLALRHGSGLVRALFNSDGTKIYTAGGHRSQCLWDIASGKLLCEFQDHGAVEIGDCRLSPDGRLLLALPRQEAPAIIYDASTGALLRPLLLSPISTAFSANGTRLVTTDSRNVARIWDVTAEELARTGPVRAWPPDKAVPATTPHRNAVRCCAIRADGSLIATGSDDTTARVWDAETGEAVSPPLKHTDRVIFVGFREGGNQLVTVSADAVIRLWTLDDGTPTERLIHLARATSGQRIDDENAAAVALKPAQIEEEWNAARAATSPESQ